MMKYIKCGYGAILTCMNHCKEAYMNKYIFLDIDGVLNSMDWFERNKGAKKHIEINPDKVKLLKEIVAQTGAKIVLSSTWRDLAAHDNKQGHEMYTYLIDALKQFGLSILDHTPYIDNNRPKEIKMWLENNINEKDVRFVSLDDDYSKESYEKYGIGNCLVKTSFWEQDGAKKRACRNSNKHFKCMRK